MIKLSDFARVQGVTPRAVQQMLKKYEKDLVGHFERKGQNGTWLDEQAQAFLRSKMLKKPVVVYDETATPLLEEIQKAKAESKCLEDENRELRNKVADVLERLTAAQTQQLQLQAELTEQKLLVAKTSDAERRAAEAETALAEAKERAETAEDVAEINRQEAEAAKLAADELREQLEKMKKRSLWQRILNKE